jgi:hypothetical protein
MILLLIGLLVFQVLLPVVSITGRRLVQHSHPFMVGLRWFSLGLLAGLLAVNYRWSHDDWLSWTVVALVVISSVRKYKDA